MLVESKWYYSGYRPSLEEYLNNGWVSSSGPVILVHALLLAKKTISTGVLDGLNKNPDLIKWPSMIFRLCNDLVTYKVSHVVVIITIQQIINQNKKEQRNTNYHHKCIGCIPHGAHLFKGLSPA